MVILYLNIVILVSKFDCLFINKYRLRGVFQLKKIQIQITYGIEHLDCKKNTILFCNESDTVSVYLYRIYLYRAACINIYAVACKRQEDIYSIQLPAKY